MTDIFRKYTDVLSLMDMIEHQRLTLLSPSLWYDQNDSYGLELYSSQKGKGRVYALCMAGTAETAHHWQIYANHSHGLCVQFDRTGLISHFNSLKGDILHGEVQYRNLTQIREMQPIARDVLPFLKRDTFKAENEYRIVAWEDEFFASDTYGIPLPLSLIRRVTFGPSMPRQLAETFKSILCAKDGCVDIPFAMSKLNNNESWRRAVTEGAVGE